MKFQKKTKLKKNVLIFLFFAFYFVFDASYCNCASQESAPFTLSQTSTKRAPPDQLKRIIWERFRTSTEVRKNIHKAVRAKKDKGKEADSKAQFLPTVRIHAAIVDAIEEKDLAAFEKTVGTLSSQGVNTLIIRMYQNYWQPRHVPSKSAVKVGAYFSSLFSPVIDDLLTPLLKIARRYQMRVFVRMSTRRCDWASERNPTWQDTGFDPATSQELVPIVGLNLFNHHVRYYLINLYRELAQKHIDGIILSDDYTLGPMEGFPTEALKEFLMLTRQEGIEVDTKKWFDNLKPSDDGGFYIEKFPDTLMRYYKWRSKKLGEFMADIVKNIRLVDSTIKVGFVMKPDFFTSQSDDFVLASLSLDINGVMKGNFDYHFAILYPSEFIEAYLNLEIGYEKLSNISRYMQNKFSGKFLWVISSNKQRDKKAASEDMIFQTIAVLDIDGGIAFQPYNALSTPSIINEFLSQCGPTD